MDPVSVSAVIDAPREQIFDYLQDVANRPAFTDHFLTDWRLTRESPVGLGAGARFRVKAPANRFSWGDLTLVDLERGRRIVEVGRTGKGNRIRTLGIYELSPGPSGTTKVNFTYETERALLSDRIRDALGARWWTKRQYTRALRRLRSIMEGAEPPGVRLPPGMPARRNPTPPARSPLLALASALLLALALSACGSADKKETGGTYAGEAGVAAPYLSLGPLVYQVQVSRALNPADEEDASYLAGLSPAQARLGSDEQWFAVFIQVYNHSNRPQLSATNVTIADSLGNRYTPVIPLGSNPYIYTQALIPAGGQLPGPDSTAASGPTQGALLLYRMRLYSLENRPIKLRVVNPANPFASVSAELDV